MKTRDLLTVTEEQQDTPGRLPLYKGCQKENHSEPKWRSASGVKKRGRVYSCFGKVERKRGENITRRQAGGRTSRGKRKTST